ncbi:MAG: hypothetical protein R8L53_00025 [Mariprofundales bacterium]
MLNCKEATRLCSEQMEQKLSLQNKINLRMHLLLCSACRHFAAQISNISQVMHGYSSGDVDIKDIKKESNDDK